MTDFLTVFISSTSDDLREHRRAVKEAVLDLGLHPIMMENFPAEGAIAVDRCRRAAHEADIFVGIYAHRYGWIPGPDQGGRDDLSITALEYEWAAARGIPRLCFVIERDFPWPHTPPHVDPEPEKRDRLDQLKARIGAETIRGTFTTPDNLVSGVLAALHHAAAGLTGHAPERGGWRRLSAPPLLHNFVGRAADLQTLRDMLTAPGDPLVVVRGAGGLGKTFLAQHLARSLADAFPGGVLWAGLGPDARTAENSVPPILMEWASANPHGRSLDPQTVSPRLVRTLLADAPGRFLAVLDDAWHLEPVRALRDALPAGTACLITTRHTDIAALGGHNVRLNRLAPADGCALLVDRLRAAGLLAVDPAECPAALAEIVQLVDGHALALDIAARQIITRGAAYAPRFAARLRESLAGEKPFGMLDLGRGETRDDSLEAAFALSYDTLSAEDQARFRALGVIAPEAAFDTPMVWAVWDVDSADDSALNSAEDSLAALLNAGLLVLTPDGARCEQHMILRTYAAALARRAGEHDPALGRYTRHVIDVLAARFVSVPVEDWNTVIGPDLPHIYYMGDLLVGYVQAIVLGATPLESLAEPDPPDEMPDIDPNERMARALLERGENFASAIKPYVFRRWVGDHGRRWLELGIACARLRGSQDREAVLLSAVGLWHSNHGQPRLAIAYFQQAFAYSRTNRNRADEAAVLNNLSTAHRAVGELDEALAALEEALTIWRELDNRVEKAVVLSNMAVILHDMGHWQRAQALYKEALTIKRDLGDQSALVSTLLGLGVLHHDLARHEQALVLFEEALTLARAAGLRSSEGTALNNIAGTYQTLGQPERARSLYEQALVIAREIGDLPEQGTTLSNLGILAKLAGAQTEALDLYQQALTVQRSVGDRLSEAITLNNMGHVYHEMEQPDAAAELINQALSIAVAINAHTMVITAGSTLGDLYRERELLELSEAAYDHVLTAARQLENRAQEGKTLNTLGLLASDQDQPDRALGLYLQALDAARDAGDKVSEAVTSFNVGLLLHNAFGRTQEAIRYLERCVALDEETGHPDLESDRATLNRLRGMLEE